MKSSFRIISFVIAILLLALTFSCKKEVRQVIPTLTTTAISNITSTTATSGGLITSDGGSSVNDRGVCWSLSQGPTTSDSKTSDGSGLGTFVSSITGLTPGTTYYFRSYAINSVGTSYGNQIIGTTQAILPTISTTSISNITESSATCGGAITYDGGSSVTARGVCWSAIQNPSIIDSKTNDGTGPSSFISSIIGLSPGTMYYVRAYATNSMGTAYGNQLTLTTLTALPTIITNEVSSITPTTASSGGNITSDGGSSVTARGVCWSSSQNPTIVNLKTTNGTGTGIFLSSITGLSPGTLYYLRAYATNSKGTAYGTQLTFTTPAVLPTIATTNLSLIALNSALSGGNITNDGGSTVIARGVCWSANLNPTISDNKTTNGTGIGIFISNLADLISNTTYYVRAYATNSVGTAYGNSIPFTTDVTDIDGNIYNTIIIGNQTWMTENLKTTRYRNGDLIGTTIPATLDISGQFNPKYQWPSGGNESNVSTYGRLYTWYAAADIRKLCPIGWHVPSNEEWSILTTFLGGSSIAGGKLKEDGTTHWQSPNTGATNSSGFTALPAGLRNFGGGTYNGIGYNGRWWTATEYSNWSVYGRSLNYDSSIFFETGTEKYQAASIRCVRD